MFDKPLILLGAGGHAGVLADLLGKSGAVIAGVSVKEKDLPVGMILSGLRRFTDIELPELFPPLDVLLINGIGTVSVSTIRKDLFLRFKEMGYCFASIEHPSAVVSGSISRGEGIQAMARSVVQPGCTIGDNCLLNTASVLEHDCRLSDHVHLASGATVCGGVQIGENSHIGAGSTLIQGVRIGSNCLVAAGAVVVRDVPDGATVMGVPAKVVQR